MQCMEVKLGTHVYFTVSMTTMTLFLITTSSLLKLANHSGEICTQVYLSVSMMSSSLRHSISIHTIGIRASVDALCRDGADEISRDPRRKRLKPQARKPS